MNLQQIKMKISNKIINRIIQWIKKLILLQFQLKKYYCYKNKGEIYNCKMIQNYKIL